MLARHVILTDPNDPASVQRVSLPAEYSTESADLRRIADELRNNDRPEPSPGGNPSTAS